MNLSAPFVVQFFGEQMSTALAYCDYVFGNETEAATFGEKHGWGSDVSTVALKLAGKIAQFQSGSDCYGIFYFLTRARTHPL